MAAILLSRFEIGIGFRPMIVWGVGKFLGFQTDGAALWIENAVFAFYATI